MVRLRAQGAAQPLAKPGGYGDLAKEQDSGTFQRGRGGKEGSGGPAVFKEESVEVRSSSLCGGKRNGQRERDTCRGMIMRDLGGIQPWDSSLGQ